MEMRWFGFFKLGRGTRESSRLWVMPGVLLAALLTHATFAASPDTSAAPDAEILALPAWDVERILPTEAKPGASSPVTPKVPRVGDSLLLTLNNAHEKAVPAESPQYTLEPLPGSDTLMNLGWQILPAEKRQPQWGFQFLGVPLKEGKVTLPSLLVKDSSGKAVARTHPLVLDVESAIAPNDPKPTEREAPAPPVGLTFPWWLIAIGMVLGLGILSGLGYFGYRAWKRRKKKAPPAVVIPPTPEDEEALARLAQLETSDWLKRREYKPYYFRLSEILKTYMGRRYDFDAPECTTSELLRALREKSGNPESSEGIATLFEQLDRVKFTDHLPDPHEVSDLIPKARDYVLKTRQPKESTHAPK